MTPSECVRHFEKYDRENPIVWELFVRFAKEARDAGHTRLSGWLIVNRIRWETAVKTRDPEFKVPNNCISFYARKLMATNPEFKGFFSTRAASSDLVDWDKYQP